MKKLGLLILLVMMGAGYYKFFYKACEPAPLAAVQSVKMICLMGMLQDPDKLVDDVCKELGKPDRDDCQPESLDEASIQKGVELVLLKCMNEELAKEDLCPVENL
jgi:hypothetical protein